MGQSRNRTKLHCLAAAKEFKVPEHVVFFAKQIKRENNHRSVQLSAATKFAAFARPKESVFIFDRFTARSARARASIVGLRSFGHSNYEQFYEIYAKTLECKKREGDFDKAVKSMRNFLVKVGGPMADQELGPFVERRLLDKLMFWEGRLLFEMDAAKRWDSDDHKLRQFISRRWWDGLKSDFSDPRRACAGSASRLGRSVGRPS